MQLQAYRTQILTSDTTWFNIMNRWPLNQPMKTRLDKYWPWV